MEQPTARQTDMKATMLMDPLEKEEERKKRVLKNMPLVYREVYKISKRLPAGVDKEELVSAGYVGLLSAVDRFDPARGLSFGAFAHHRVRGAILDELRALDTISRRRRKKRREMDKIQRELTAQLGRPPSSEELAERMEISIEDLHSEQMELASSVPISFDSLDSGSGSLWLWDKDRYPLPDSHLQKKQLKQRLAKSIEKLPSREKTIISLYYYNHMAYREIADMFGVTESRVCQIHRSACNRIKKWMEAEEEACTSRTLH